MLLRELLEECFEMKHPTEEERVEFFKEYIDEYGNKDFLFSDVYSSRGSDTKRLRILRGDDGAALIRVSKRKGKIFKWLMINPINTSDETLIDLCNRVDFWILTEDKARILNKGKYLESNYYCNVDESWLKYNTNKWRQSRKVDINNPMITFREVTPDDLVFIDLIQDAWASSVDKANFKRYYKKIRTDLTADGFKYYGYVTCYRGIPLIARYYWEYNGYVTVDYEVSITKSLYEDNVESLALKEKVFNTALALRREELRTELQGLLTEKEKLLSERSQYRQDKDWKNVKKIDKSLTIVEGKIVEASKWRETEKSNLENFINKSLTNYNRYKFMEMLKDKGYKFYFEDIVGGGVDTPLRQYKEKKNDYTVNYYYYKK